MRHANGDMAVSERMGAMSNLTARALVGVVLVAVALGAVYAGGFGFGVLVAFACLMMFTEWAAMFRIPRGWRLAGMTVLAIALAMAQIEQSLIAIAALATGAGVLMLGARPYLQARATWIAGGVLYAGLPGIALIWLRGSGQGLALTLFTLTIVWATDIAAYFAGRTIGGPKLAPSISPNKTWAGLAGGMAGAGATGLAMAKLFDLPLWLAGAAVVLAVVAQGGDLFESWLKRRVGVKDSGTLLPGHGGVLDRLDGLVPVALVVALGAALVRFGAVGHSG
jgi:phosphatidate cytidylyltransferase